MTKDEWIQRAKALLFDLTFSEAEYALRVECKQLISDGGGYDYETETSKTPLRWRD